MKNRAVFIDRDGTINTLVEYLDNPEQFVLIEGSAEAIKLLNINKYKVVVVTNQSGLGRGFFSEATLEKINDEFYSQLSEMGAEIDGFYYCPHKPEDGCSCRKPRTGLLEKASKDLSIDPLKSFMIGDRLSDIQAGVRFGCKPILVLTGYGESELSKVKKSLSESISVASNLLEAVEKTII